MFFMVLSCLSLFALLDLHLGIQTFFLLQGVFSTECLNKVVLEICFFDKFPKPQTDTSRLSIMINWHRRSSMIYNMDKRWVSHEKQVMLTIGSAPDDRHIIVCCRLFVLFFIMANLLSFYLIDLLILVL